LSLVCPDRFSSVEPPLFSEEWTGEYPLLREPKQSDDWEALNVEDEFRSWLEST
jgi:hypothetical protein